MKSLKRIIVGSIALSVTVLISACSSEVDIIEVAPVPAIESQFTLKNDWKNSTSGNTTIYSLLGPTYSNGVVFAAGRDGQVKAIALESGKTLWNSDVSQSSLFSRQSALLSGGVSADEKYVYVGSERAVVYALDRETGKLIWQQNVRGEVIADPVSSEGKILVHTTNGFLQALNRDTGLPEWENQLETEPLSLRGESTPAIARGAAIVGDDNGRVNAFFVKDGQLIWQQRIAQPGGSTEIAKLNDVDSSPVVIGGVVFAMAYNGNLVSLDLSSGQTIWRRDIGSTHSFIADSDSGRIIVVDKNDTLYSVAINSGSVLWTKSDLLNRQLTDPVLYKGDVVVGDFEGYLYWLDIQTGNFIHSQKVDSSGFLSKPLVANDKLIIQARNGNIYAFER